MFVYVKLLFNVIDIIEIVCVIVDVGVDGLIFINIFIGMRINLVWCMFVIVNVMVVCLD